LRRRAPSPRLDLNGCRATLPQLLPCRAGVSLSAPPQVDVFPGGGAVAGAR
jgi:hypothetical protein